jgi:hypothetical protein
LTKPTLKKLILRLNKENEPPDGWKPEDKVQAASNRRLKVQAASLTKQKYKII